MDAKAFGRIRDSLLEQSQNIEEWLQQAPEEEKQTRLGPLPETAIHQHLEVLQTSVEKAEDKTLGLCTVCNDYVETSRLEVDYTACVCIDHYTEDQRRKLEKELELSQKVQKALLPQEAPSLAGLQIAAYSQPARIVGGDYFDFFHYKDGAPGFVIADVMGKGVAASLLMASLQASLRILVTQEDRPDEVIKRLNQLFCHNINLTKFVTLFIARYDQENRRLTYCNAGHNPPLLFGKRSRWLQPTSPAIGLVEDFKCSSDSIELSSGETLLLYTDGVTEAHDSTEEEFGEARLADIAMRNADRSPGDILDALRSELREFTDAQSPEDDTTILTVKIL